MLLLLLIEARIGCRSSFRRNDVPEDSDLAAAFPRHGGMAGPCSGRGSRPCTHKVFEMAL
jgi:hypothetical protein